MIASIAQFSKLHEPHIIINMDLHVWSNAILYDLPTIPFGNCACIMFMVLSSSLILSLLLLKCNQNSFAWLSCLLSRVVAGNMHFFSFYSFLAVLLFWFLLKHACAFIGKLLCVCCLFCDSKSHLITKWFYYLFQCHCHNYCHC